MGVILTTYYITGPAFPEFCVALGEVFGLLKLYLLFPGVCVCVILLMAEIRRSPVEVGSLSHYLQGFSTIPGGAGFQPSAVLWEVWPLKFT